MTSVTDYIENLINKSQKIKVTSREEADQKIVELLLSGEADNKKVSICKICRYQSTDSSRTKRHIETHLEGISYDCQYCDKKYSGKTSLQRHLKDHRTNENMDVDEKSNDSSNLEEHDINVDTRSIHDTSVSTDQTQLENTSHKIKVTSREEADEKICKFFLADENKKLFTCKICGYNSNQSYMTKRHIKSHLEGIYHHCNNCDKKYSVKSSLQRHQKDHHSGYEYNDENNLNGQSSPGNSTEVKTIIKVEENTY